MLHNTQSDLIVAAYLRTQFPDTAGVFLREAGLDEESVIILGCLE